jgi:hypothetical protein
MIEVAEVLRWCLIGLQAAAVVWMLLTGLWRRLPISDFFGCIHRPESVTIGNRAMIGYVITIVIFIALQVGSGLIILTKLQGGQSSLKEHLDSLASSVARLSDAVATINISDARYEERYTTLLSSMGNFNLRVDAMQKEIQRLRSKSHQLSGFVMRTFPEWREFERERDEEG